MTDDPTRNDGQHRGMSGAEEDNALDALIEAWGEDYEIYLTGDQWQAWHRGALVQDVLAGSTPGELAAAIRADAARRSAL